MSNRHLKTGRKRLAGRCLFCSETALGTLDAHRAFPGAEGGTYIWGNILVLCANCHRKVHAGEIAVIGRHPTSRGRVAVIALVGGEEKIFFEPSVLED